METYAKMALMERTTQNIKDMKGIDETNLDEIENMLNE